MTILFALLYACTQPTIGDYGDDTGSPSSGDDTSSADDTNTYNGPLPEIYVNEIVPSNSNPEVEECGDSDWFELYNAESTSQNLTGMYVSDDPENPTRYALPSGTAIPAGGHLVICADGNADGLHTDFKLKRSGEYAGLYGTDEQQNSLIDAYEYAEIEADFAHARIPDGGDWEVVEIPTPGDENRAGPP